MQEKPSLTPCWLGLMILWVFRWNKIRNYNMLHYLATNNGQRNGSDGRFLMPFLNSGIMLAESQSFGKVPELSDRVNLIYLYDWSYIFVLHVLLKST